MLWAVARCHRSNSESEWRGNNRTDADFQAWRDQRDWTARKYAMWEWGERLPSQKLSSLLTCPCGEVFDSDRLEQTLIHVPHISAAESAPSEDEMTGERHTQFDRESSKRAAEGLVIQFRVERAAKRVAWFAVATVVVALILSVPGVSRLIVKLMQ